MRKLFDWKKLLTQWGSKMVVGKHIEDARVDYWRNYWRTHTPIMKTDAIHIKCIGVDFFPAREEEIQKIERKIGLSLPPSYRSFLTVTNGWPHVEGDILSVEKIEPMIEYNPDMIKFIDHESLEEIFETMPEEGYFDYDSNPFPVIPRSHFRKSILIGHENPECLLWRALNPEVITSDGEWEAWFYIKDGIIRYRSFGEMMFRDYKRFFMRKGDASLFFKQDPT